MGDQNSVPSCSPLWCILQNWEIFSYAPMNERKWYFIVTLLGLSTPWDLENNGPYGALNYNTIFQLELFCRRKENGMRFLMYRLLCYCIKVSLLELVWILS